MVWKYSNMTIVACPSLESGGRDLFSVLEKDEFSMSQVIPFLKLAMGHTCATNDRIECYL
jgi:hypothetical protein